jgi:peptidoglycan/LPS O-acetylase OafA/YrhL
MFESIEPDDDGIKFNVATVCFVLGWLPFVITWGQYNTAFTEWLVQTYFLTVFVLIVYPRQFERKNLKRLWLWKAMLVVALVLHPAILAALSFVDKWEKTKWHEARTMLTLILLAGVIEFPLLYKIVDFFRPPGESR